MLGEAEPLLRSRARVGSSSARAQNSGHALSIALGGLKPKSSDMGTVA